MSGLMPSTPNFSEDDILIFLTRVIERSSRYLPYEIEPISRIDEVRLGYDAVVTGVYQLYFQFKVSKYTYDAAKSKFIKARSGFAFDDTLGVMNFALREPAESCKKNPDKLQHNILFKLSNLYPGRVCYVAPTFTDKTLLNPLAIPWAFLEDILIPFKYMPTKTKVGPVTYLAHEVPFLRNLVSIVPHARVKTHKHNYVYNFSNEVSFHSDPADVGRSVSILSYLTKMFRDSSLLQEASGWENANQLSRKTEEIIESIFGGLENMFELVSSQSLSQLSMSKIDIRSFNELSPIAKRRFVNLLLRDEFDVHAFTLLTLGE